MILVLPEGMPTAHSRPLAARHEPVSRHGPADTTGGPPPCWPAPLPSADPPRHRRHPRLPI